MDDAKRWDIIHQKIHKEAEWHSVYAEDVEKLFPRNSLVVDLGAGTGADALYFLKEGHSVIALDISAFALSVVGEKAKKAKLEKKLVARQTDFGMHAIPIKDNSVDIAYSRISLNYFGAKQTTKLFSDIYRVLKPGGRAFITLKSPDDLLEMEYFEKSSTVYEPNVFIEGGMLRSRFTVDQLRIMLKNAGVPQFEVRPFQEDLGKKGVGHHPHLFVNEVTFTKL